MARDAVAEIIAYNRPGEGPAEATAEARAKIEAARANARRRDRRASASREKSAAVPRRSAFSVFQKNGTAAAKHAASPAAVFG